MSGPEWKGLFEWTMRHSDGTRLSDVSQTEVDPAKMAWLQEVLSNYVKDLTSRLQEIKQSLEETENAESSLQYQEALLDELQDIVEDIDEARNLHSIGGLPMLLELLDSPHRSLRSRAAEVVATCVQNNRPVQQVFYDQGALPKVLAVAQDAEVHCQLKGWMGVSCLIRNFQPAQGSFLEMDGLQLLARALHSEDVRLQRRGLFLLQYLLSDPQGAGHLATLQEEHAVERAIHLVASEDADLREKALAVLLAVGKHPQGRDLLKSSALLQQRCQEFQRSFGDLSAEEKETQSLERQLVTELQEALKRDDVPQAVQTSSKALQIV